MLAPTLLLALTTLAAPVSEVDARYTVFLKERAPNAIVEQVTETRGNIEYELWLDIQNQVLHNLDSMAQKN